MFHKLSDKLMTKTGLYFIVFLIQAITVPMLHIPIMTDAVNPLALGFMARGVDWSRYLIADGYYYKYGQLLVYFPFVYFIKNNVVLYRVLLTVNIAIVSFIPVCVFIILNKYLKCADIEKNWFISLLIGFLPTITLNSKYTWAEPFLMVLQWIILLLLLEIMNDDCSKRKKIFDSIILAVLQVYAYMVHTRGIVILIVTIMCVCMIRFLFKSKHIQLHLYFMVTFALMVFDKVFSTVCKQILYGDTDNLAGGSLSFFNLEFLKNLLSLKGLKIWGEEIIGWLFASIISTVGLTSLGLVVSVSMLLHFRKWKKLNKPELMVIIFSILCFFGALVLGTVFFFNDFFFIEKMEITIRGDKLIYARYLNGAGACVSFAGLYFYFINEKIWKAAHYFYSVMLFLLLHGFFSSIIAEKIDHTITWIHTLVTINYFCNLEQCIRGGLYTTVDFLAGGIGFFSLLSFLFFLFAIRHKKYFLVSYLVVFIMGFLWNSYNVIYRADHYTMEIIEKYEDVIKSVQGEEELSNLYLDDEILRCGFQFYFSEYYILTKRDENRYDVQNMFIISPNKIFNEELYDDDYFEVIDLDGENLDYHLYIKGEVLNERLQNNGYATREIIQIID